MEESGAKKALSYIPFPMPDEQRCFLSLKT